MGREAIMSAVSVSMAIAFLSLLESGEVETASTIWAAASSAFAMS